MFVNNLVSISFNLYKIPNMLIISILKKKKLRHSGEQKRYDLCFQGILGVPNTANLLIGIPGYGGG